MNHNKHREAERRRDMDYAVSEQKVRDDKARDNATIRRINNNR